MRGFECWSESEENSCHKRNDEREQEDMRVHVDIVGARQRAGKNGQPGCGSPRSEKQAEPAADEREKDALCKKLADNAALACT